MRNYSLVIVLLLSIIFLTGQAAWGWDTSCLSPSRLNNASSYLSDRVNDARAKARSYYSDLTQRYNSPINNMLTNVRGMVSSGAAALAGFKTYSATESGKGPNENAQRGVSYFTDFLKNFVFTPQNPVGVAETARVALGAATSVTSASNSRKNINQETPGLDLLASINLKVNTVIISFVNNYKAFSKTLGNPLSMFTQSSAYTKLFFSKVFSGQTNFKHTYNPFSWNRLHGKKSISEQLSVGPPVQTAVESNKEGIVPGEYADQNRFRLYKK